MCETSSPNRRAACAVPRARINVGIEDRLLYTGGSRIAGWQTVATSNYVGIAIDFDKKLIWARTSANTNWNNSGTADPATGVGGFSFDFGCVAPTVGNLLIALIGCNIAAGSITIGSGWTLFDEVQSGGNVVMTALYRYAQSGDTTSLPAFWSAGTTWWTHEVWEVSGVSGTWDTDFLSSIPLPGAQSNAALPQFPIFIDGLALTGTASYDGSTNPSITGSWTLDDTNNNRSNYGSAAGAHRVVTNGDTIDGTWTQGSSAPYGGILVLLTTAQPSGGVYPRHVYTIGGNGTPGSTTVPWTPQAGNLLLCYLYWDEGARPAVTINTSYWTEWTSALLTTKAQYALYRYVQSGDTGALPSIATAGSDYYMVTFIELAGGSGSFGTDHASDKTGGQFSGDSLTTTADTT